MKRFRILMLSMLLITVYCNTSCRRNSYYGSEDCANYDYSDCNTNEPSLVALNIKLTINEVNTKVPITIYEGEVEENKIVLNDSVSTSKYSVLLPGDKYYSVKVRYVKEGKIIYAIGGDYTKKILTTVCDSSCWSTEEGNINVELKD